MPPLLLPVYSSPSEAFALSVISSPIDFRDELHRMFFEGLAGKGIRELGGTREDIPREAWLDHVPTLAGEVLTQRLYAVDITYGAMLSSCRLDFSDNAKGMASYRVAIEQPGYHLDVERRASYRVNQPRLVWYDLRFLTKDFLDRLREKDSATKRGTAIDVAKEIIAASGLSEQELRDPNAMKWLRASRAYRARKDRPSDDAFRRALNKKE